MPKSVSKDSKPSTGRASSSRTKSTSAKSTAGGRGTSSAKTSRSKKSAQPSFRFGSLSLDRKLDIVGVILALIGFLTLLSLVSTQRGSVTGAWINALNKVAGWGTFVLPLALLVLGLWLVLRNIERMPVLSTERIVGITLLYFNILVVFHAFGGGTWELADAGKGGGYIGAFFWRGLINALGPAGGWIVVLGWFVIAIVFTFDLSIPELYRKSEPIVNKVQKTITERPKPAPRVPRLDNDDPDISKDASGELPSDFRPLTPTAADAQPARLKTASRGKTSSTETGSAVPATEQPVHTRASTSEKPVVTTQSSTPSSAWVLPTIDTILDPATAAAVQTNVDQERAKLIEDTLASFGAPAHVVDISRGPTITRFGVEPDFVEGRNGRMRVRVSKIASLADDLALALAASRIRIQAPVPGRSYVGIEVPNPEISRVAMREVLESDAFRKIRSPLRFTLGKDVAGKPIGADLAAMPHLLIAGTTGSGKSVCVNSILCCLLINNTPADLRMILVDPKRVELTGYNGVPHLLAPVVVDTERVVGALQWLQREMDARYHRFSQVGSRNIQDYNSKHADKLPYLVAVIDELADLMMLAPDETERSITRLAQLARATGIHLILATQRPSVDVVTGLIKANFPARVAFAVASTVDSRVILDQPGAERLLGRGDMLFQAPDAPAPVRLQGVYVSDPEIQRLVDYWRTQSATVGSQAPVATTAQSSSVDALPSSIPLKQGEFWDVEEEGDPLLNEAIDLVRREGRASITMLQRRMRIGYTRAARMVDAMEEKGIISPALPNSQVREVLDYGPTAPPKEE